MVVPIAEGMLRQDGVFHVRQQDCAKGAEYVDKIGKVAGAGTFVPITGFANSVVSPALEFKAEGHILGTGAKMFNLAGPVIVYGCGAASVYGLIYWIIEKI